MVHWLVVMGVLLVLALLGPTSTARAEDPADPALSPRLIALIDRLVEMVECLRVQAPDVQAAEAARLAQEQAREPAMDGDGAVEPSDAREDRPVTPDAVRRVASLFKFNQQEFAMSYRLEQLSEHLHVEPPISYQRLTVCPLTMKRSVSLDYLLLPEAQEQKTVEVEEISNSGSVPTF